MRVMIRTVAALALVGGALSAAPAFAGFDEAQQNSFWTHQTVNTAPAPASDARGSAQRNSEYRATYTQPRVESPAASAPKVEEDPYFYHSMGTMSRP